MHDTLIFSKPQFINPTKIHTCISAWSAWTHGLWMRVQTPTERGGHKPNYMRPSRCGFEECPDDDWSLKGSLDKHSNVKYHNGNVSPDQTAQVVFIYLFWVTTFTPEIPNPVDFSGRSHYWHHPMEPGRRQLERSTWCVSVRLAHLSCLQMSCFLNWCCPSTHVVMSAPDTFSPTGNTRVNFTTTCILTILQHR